MRVDSLFYVLMQAQPTLLFELLSLDRKKHRAAGEILAPRQEVIILPLHHFAKS